MELKRRATLRDVANLAGVSIATASIALNGQHTKRITPETISNVVHAAEQLGYQPNLHAQTLKGKRSTIIGLVIPDITNAFYPEITKGVIDRAYELGYNVVLFNTDNDIQKEKFAIETLTSMRSEGIILCGIYNPGEEEHGLLQKLRNIHVPVVQIDRYDARGIVPYVAIDNFRAAYAMMEWLIQLGHQRIAAVTPGLQLHITDERLRGYRQALEDYNLPYDPALVLREYISEMQKVKVDAAVDTLIRSQCTAAFILMGDMFALECMDKLRAKGIRVPEDMSIAGFDDIRAAGAAGLTAVRQPKYEMGQAAADLLCSILQGDNLAGKSIVLPYEIVQRGSVCAYN